jgi:hypothetical protein
MVVLGVLAVLVFVAGEAPELVRGGELLVIFGRLGLALAQAASRRATAVKRPIFSRARLTLPMVRVSAKPGAVVLARAVGTHQPLHFGCVAPERCQEEK